MSKKTLGYGALTPTKQGEVKACLKKYDIQYMESEMDNELVLLNVNVTCHRSHSGSRRGSSPIRRPD